MERKISEIHGETPGQPYLSVVIPAYNEEQYLPTCLRALRQQKDAPPYEIIVVDNASTDGTADIARQCGACVVTELRKGVARARQAGFEAACGEIIASTDADTRVTPHWLARIAAHFRDDLALAFNYGGRAKIVDAARAISAAHRRGELDAEVLDEAVLRRYLYCPDLPDADLIIRTGGEWRLSNFLLWRAVGAVFWSTPILWPDFQREHLLAAIQVYQEQSGEESCLNVDAK